LRQPTAAATLQVTDRVYAMDAKGQAVVSINCTFFDYIVIHDILLLIRLFNGCMHDSVNSRKGLKKKLNIMLT
jgi:hypothetical protein